MKLSFIKFISYLTILSFLLALAPKTVFASLPAPSNLRATPTAYNAPDPHIRLDWDYPPTSDYHYFASYISTDNANFSMFYSANSSFLSSIYRTTTFNQRYYLYVESCDFTSCTRSATVSGTIEGPAIIEPVLAIPINQAGGEVTLRLYDKSDNETGFIIERSTSQNSGFIEIATLPQDNYEYIDKDLDELQTYYYRVKAFNDSQVSAYSNVAQGVSRLLNPSDFKVWGDKINNKMEVRWTDQSLHEDGYQVFLNRPPDSSAHKDLPANSNSVSFDINTTTTVEYEIVIYTRNGNYPDHFSMVSQNIAFPYPEGYLPNPELIGFLSGTGDTQVLGMTDGINDVVISNSNDKAYISSTQFGFGVLNISKTPPELFSETSTQHPYDKTSRIAVSADETLALSVSSSLNIIDTTDKSYPRVVGNVPDATGELYWKDNYVYINGKHDNTPGIKIIDISTPGNPVVRNFLEMQHVLQPAGYDDTLVFISDGYLHFYDLSNRANPVFKSKIQIEGTIRELKTAVINGKKIAFIGGIGVESNESIYYVQAIDFTNILTPEIISNKLKTSYFFNFTVDNDRLFISNGSYGMSVISASDPRNLTLIKQYQKEEIGSVPHISFVKNDRLYLVNAGIGLTTVDISNIEAPRIISNFDDRVYYYETRINESRHLGVSGHYGGLKIIDYSDPSKLKVVKKLDIGASHPYLLDNYVYSAVANQLKIFDITTPSEASLVKTVDTSPGNEYVVAGGNYLVLCQDLKNKIEIFDISNRTNPQLLGSLAMTRPLRGEVKIINSVPYAFIGTYSGLLNVINLQNRTIVKSLNTGVQNAQRINIYDNLLFFCHGGNGFDAIDISDPTNPIVKAKVKIHANAAAFKNGFAYVAGTTMGVQVVDLRNFNNPVVVYKTPAINMVNDLVMGENYLYGADYISGFQVYKLYKDEVKASLVQSKFVVSQGEEFTNKLKVENFSPNIYNDMRITSPIPFNTTVVSIDNGGYQSEGLIVWDKNSTPFLSQIGPKQVFEASFVLKAN